MGRGSGIAHHLAFVQGRNLRCESFGFALSVIVAMVFRVSHF
ncbi:hypothetical protein ABE522_06090 [Stenotrophomonas pennii]